MSQTIQVSDIFRPSWRLCKSQIWILAGLLIGYMLISFTLSVFMTPLNKSLSGVIVSQVINWVISVIFSLGYAKNMLQTIDGEEPQFSAYLQPIGKIINMIIATVLVCFAVVVGFVLLIIPGFYFLIRLQFVSLYILEEDAGSIEAIQKSWRLTQGKMGFLVMLLLTQLLLVVIGVCLLGVGLLVTLPLCNMLCCYTFRELIKPVYKVEEE